MTALYRTTDPQTSREAIAELKASGRHVTHTELVLSCVQLWPGSTAAEIGVTTGLGHVASQRRLSELMREGKVRQGDARYSQHAVRVSSRRMSTWWPVYAEPEQGALL